MRGSDHAIQAQHARSSARLGRTAGRGKKNDSVAMAYLMTSGSDTTESTIQCQYLRGKFQASCYFLERCLRVFPALPSSCRAGTGLVGGTRTLWHSGLAGMSPR